MWRGRPVALDMHMPTSATGGVGWARRWACGGWAAGGGFVGGEGVCKTARADPAGCAGRKDCDDVQGAFAHGLHPPPPAAGGRKKPNRRNRAPQEDVDEKGG